MVYDRRFKAEQPAWTGAAQLPLQPLRIIPLLNRPISELDWLNEVVRGLDTSIEPYQAPVPVRDGTLFIYNSDQALKLPDALLSEIRQSRGCGLLHLGDEYLRSDLRAYSAFEFVIRMFPFPAADARGVLPLPLGFTNDLGPRTSVPANQRQHLWLFAGDLKADRGALVARFRNVSGGLMSATRSWKGERGISRQEYLQALATSVFSLSPAGNISLETCRPYESLELGAIPILPRRRHFDAYALLFGAHPMPVFENWEKAAGYVEKMRGDTQGQLSLQAECGAWWLAEKAKITRKLMEFVQAGRAGEFGPSVRQRFTDRGISPLDRFGTLLAQQNTYQLKKRLMQTLPRLLGGGLANSGMRGVWTIDPAMQTPPEPASEGQSTTVFANSDSEKSGNSGPGR